MRNCYYIGNNRESSYGKSYLYQLVKEEGYMLTQLIKNLSHKSSLKKLLLGSSLVAITIVASPNSQVWATPSIPSYTIKSPAISQPEGKEYEKAESRETMILAKVAAAQKLLARDCDLDETTVGISMLERKSGELYFVKMAKPNFITKDYQEDYTLEDGTAITVHIDQPNFINTKVSIQSQEGDFLPLTVKYPIIRKGAFKEMGYYTPAHRSLQEFGLAKLGEEYVQKILTDSKKSLRKAGIDIPEKVVKLAKLLCIVEHIDHGRYRREDTGDLTNEVHTLFALNRERTYRYAVSSAGAGGMVQMIPKTYREISSAFPEVDWIGNFEEAMMNHPNASKAMLLYLNRYYTFFLSHDSVDEAVEKGFATEEELMAAGYNSNPVRVPPTLAKGAYWKRSLPQETQIYLSILRSLDNSVTTAPPSAVRPPVDDDSETERETRVVYHPNRAAARNARVHNQYKASHRSVRVTSRHNHQATHIVNVRSKRSTSHPPAKPHRSRRYR